MTLIFVFTGIVLQYALGLGLAMLLVQRVPWRRFFRIVFLIPLTITPVGDRVNSVKNDDVTLLQPAGDS